MQESTRRICATFFMAAIMVATILWFRAKAVGWLLPDGSALEALAQRLREADEPIAQAVFSGVWEWFGA